MNFKFIVVLIAVIILTTINLFVKLLGYSFKAKKYGIKTNATFIGYYVYYDLKNIMWYPVVKFQNMNGIEVVALSKCLITFPIYKVGDVIQIEYYSDDFNTSVTKEIYTNRFTTKKETININKNVKFNILDAKHLLDLIIEVIFIVFSLIIIFY